MERKYTETDKELMLKLLEMQELTAPISLSIGSVVDGQVTQGIILHKAGLSTLFQTNFFRLFFRYCTGV